MKLVSPLFLPYLLLIEFERSVPIPAWLVSGVHKFVDIPTQHPPSRRSLILFFWQSSWIIDHWQWFFCLTLSFRLAGPASLVPEGCARMCNVTDNNLIGICIINHCNCQKTGHAAHSELDTIWRFINAIFAVGILEQSDFVLLPKFRCSELEGFGTPEYYLQWPYECCKCLSRDRLLCCRALWQQPRRWTWSLGSECGELSASIK